GLLVYAAGGFFSDIPVKLVVLDEAGRAEPLPGFDQPSVAPHGQFSPDGRQFAFSERGRTGLLRLFDVQRHTVRALSDEGVAHDPRWSPDGTRLVVGWSMAGPAHLWLVPIEGGGDWQRLTKGEDYDDAPAWSPDGR